MPADLPQDLLQHLQKVWVAGRQLNITRDGDEPIKSAPKKKFGEKKPHRKGRKLRRVPGIAGNELPAQAVPKFAAD